MARHIAEISVNGKTYYISQSELDIPGTANQLYVDTKRGGGMNSLPTKFCLRNDEIMDYFTGKRVDRFELQEAVRDIYS